MLQGSRWYHFIGIGGIGMSALAQIMVSHGHKVTGSDIKESSVTRRLQSYGIEIMFGHSPKNICKEIDWIVVSTAINKENLELEAGVEQGVRILHRGELLALLFNTSKGIAVAGAHGKTTTTAMLAVALTECGLSPTVIIGGDVPYFQGNAQLGKSELMVAEADESDGSFLGLRPQVAIITNIEDDHLDYYGSMEKVEQAFYDFTYRTSQAGISVLCTDDPKVRNLAEHISSKITYGLDSGDLTVKNITYLGLGLSAQIFYQEQLVGTLNLNVPGKHNLLNALGVIGVGIYLGIEPNALLTALSKFNGVKRRFEIIGTANGVRVIDDYAHHPTEIKVTLAAAKKATVGKVVAIFQPHRFSRTEALYQQFATAFADADVVIFDEIYSAGEKPLDNVSTELIIDAMSQENVYYCPGKEKIIELVNSIAESGDIVITLGAGDIWEVADEMCHNN